MPIAFCSRELCSSRPGTTADVGFGGAVTPGPVDAVYPVLIADLPAPRLRTYPVYTVVSEKLHAIAVLGMTNTRLKDYLDLSVLLSRETLDADVLGSAIAATFTRRGTEVLRSPPVGLSDQFANDPSRQALWQAVLRKNDMDPRPLAEVVALLRAELAPAMLRAAALSGIGPVVLSWLDRGGLRPPRG